ncbi:TROVE domain-containing protein [Adhaeribacter pallidiroseus]|uniref:Telomerase protein component n=1 Tax=Adhaeribacter pallidiroseus TaxID=2072847 RepID=A0A369QB20_9BACT|nr:TROVE domain-containing protein [Adhaeribacter pallidiroseus]RDC61904.1 Telomerase protein component [Adhaeribacter pallidiroseus]
MRFNFFRAKETATTNHEEALAFPLDVRTELYTAVVTTSLQDNFYEKTNERLNRIVELIAQNDAVFVAKLAVYARTRLHLRSIPLVLVIELARLHTGDSLVSRTIYRVISRADEITELLAYYQLSNQRQNLKKLNRLSKQVQKGIALAFNKFDAYQFAKYNRAAEVRLRDALFLVHPKAKDAAQQELFDNIINNTLATPFTWETELSALGQVAFETAEQKSRAFTAKWEELLDSGKLGYMALLRNLRNILEANVSGEHVARLGAYLANEKAVKNAKQLPFRYLAAYREVLTVKSGFTAYVLTALEEAVKVSIRNVKGFAQPVKVVIACDVSGSMQQPVSARSKILLYDIGLLLGMLLQHQCRHVMTGMFGDRWKLINLPQTNVLQNVQEFYRRAGEVGYSTNGYLVIRDLIQRKVKADKVLLFTDCQLWNSTGDGGHLAQEWQQYKVLFPGARLYLFDLAGYGQAPVHLVQNSVFLIAGWSDKVFEVLEAIENGQEALAVIDAIEI